MRILLFITSLLLSHLFANDIDILVANGSSCNNLLFYEEALTHLNAAIRLDPENKAARIERAISYFELDRIDLALQDYEYVVRKKPPYQLKAMSSLFLAHISPPVRDNATLDFATGLLQGAWQGGREETADCLTCIRGSLFFLWSFVCSPIDVSKEIVDAVYAMGEFLAYAKIADLLEIAAPELVECRAYWPTWSNHMRGQKMGYIIGKYGIGVFFFVSFQKGTYVFGRLKRANMMAILERCSTSEKAALILKESAKCAAKNERILKKVLSGSIIAHNPNVAPHVLQKRHYWSRFIPLTGNTAEDFKMVTAFLEHHQILKSEGKLVFSHADIFSYRYSIIVENETVVAIFSNTKGSNHFFLKDAWIETKIPFSPYPD